MSAFSLPGLQAFLGKTLAETYATGGNKVAVPQRTPFNEYEVIDGPWRYRDSYFGGAISWGQELVFLNEDPVWSLVYGGGMLKDFWGDAALEHATFGCMKKALLQSRRNTEEFLPRGPRCVVDGDFVYQAEWQGNIEWFRGEEKVYQGDRLLHIYTFAGGLFVGKM